LVWPSNSWTGCRLWVRL